MNYFLEPGLYEISAPVSWKRVDRYFAIVSEDGALRRITREEVDRCLSEV